MSTLFLVKIRNYKYRPFATSMASSVYVRASRQILKLSRTYAEETILVAKGQYVQLKILTRNDGDICLMK